jgi:hypothetical protein
MDNDNVTPLSTSPAAVPVQGPPNLADQIHDLRRSVQDTFCTLEAASAALEKAENESDVDRWIRAARVVEHCCKQLKQIRDDVDSLRVPEVAHG